MTFRSSKGWTWNGQSWQPPDRAGTGTVAVPVGRVVAHRRIVKLQRHRPEHVAAPGGMATLTGFDSLISFGAAGPAATGIASPIQQRATAAAPASAGLATVKPATVRLVPEEDEEHEPVTLVGLGISPATGASASVFDHLSYEGRDWSAEEIERIGQKSEKRSWERRRHDEPIWPWLLSGALFIAGVVLMLGNLTGLYVSYQPLGMLVSAMGLLVLHSKARDPIRVKHVSAIVAIMLAVTLFSGTRSYASNQSPAPAAHESPR